MNYLSNVCPVKKNKLYYIRTTPEMTSPARPSQVYIVGMWRDHLNAGDEMGLINVRAEKGTEERRDPVPVECNKH